MENNTLLIYGVAIYLFIGLLHIIIIKRYGGYYAKDFKGFWNIIQLLFISPIIFIILLIALVIETPFIIIKTIYEFIRYDIPYYIKNFKRRRR